MRILIIAAAVFFTATVAKAETFPVIKDKTVLEVCGDCHMAFPPQTLPKAVWKKMIGDLANHFGEDASIEPGQIKTVLDYHVKNASDVSNVRAAKKWRAKGSFARIIDAPRFKKKHGNCPAGVWAHKKVNSKANCLACHTTMHTNGSTDAKMKFLSPKLQKLCGDDD